MKVLKINLSHLRNEEHFQFQSEFKASVIRFGVQTLGIEVQFADYLILFNQEFEALQVIRKSATTEQLSIADGDRDDVFRGFVDAVKSATNHFNNETREAAKRLKIILDQYGNVVRRPYNEETAAVTKLIQECTENCGKDILLLNLSEWVNELRLRNDSFDMLMKSRFSEDAAKTEFRMQKVRLEIDAAYRSITERLDALMIVNGDQSYELFVKELNARIEKYNGIINQRKGRSAKDKEKVES